MHRESGGAVADKLANPVDHHRRRVAHSANPLDQNKFSVVD
ncbi:hypothetical protein CAB90_02712 [Mycobacterium tuberculosis]|nr:hypothetical protein CAB90_02712 [Mycobacterium tuberculosis]CPA49755.1 Uncharacterised protein [Mycobacterium tuberculosis]